LISSDEDVIIDDSNDSYDKKKGKSRKRKLEKSDSDILAPSKTRGKTSTKQVTAASITSNDSNQSGSSRSKRNTKFNGNYGSELQSEEEISSYDELPLKSKRNRNTTKCKKDLI
jgi:hypothetical protein